MKKALALLVVSFLLIGSSYSQVKVSGGVLGGVNLANLNFSPEPTGQSFDNLTGFGVGGVLNFDFSGGFCIKAEPMYLQAGSKTTMSGVDVKLKVNYISIPILFMYVIQTAENQIMPYFFAGPSLGLKTGAKITGENSSASVDVDVSDQVKSTDLGAVLGAGINIPAGMNTIFLEGRYSLGLTDINNDPTTTGTIKTKGIQFFAGILFPFGG